MKRVLILTCLVSLLTVNSFSQCAMCKATAESSGIGGGLNDGILYLMFIPYILLGAFVIFVLRKKIVSFYKDFKGRKEDKEFTIDNWY